MKVRINLLASTFQQSEVLSILAAVASSDAWVLPHDREYGDISLSHSIVLDHPDQNDNYRCHILAEKPLGKGAFGFVYSVCRTIDINPNGNWSTPVTDALVVKVLTYNGAVKTLNEFHYMLHAESRDANRFLYREPEAGDSLRYLREDCIYMMMKRCVGREWSFTRQRKHQRKPLTPGRACSMSIQLLEQIAYMHTVLAKAHRDLKPANIMYDESRSILTLVDFGMSSGLGIIDRVVGTPLFWGPEVARLITKKKLSPDMTAQKADVFAAGALLFNFHDIDPLQLRSQASATKSGVDAYLAVMNTAFIQKGAPGLSSRYPDHSEYSAAVAPHIISMCELDVSKRPHSVNVALVVFHQQAGRLIANAKELCEAAMLFNKSELGGSSAPIIHSTGFKNEVNKIHSILTANPLHLHQSLLCVERLALLLMIHRVELINSFDPAYRHLSLDEMEIGQDDNQSVDIAGSLFVTITDSQLPADLNSLEKRLLTFKSKLSRVDWSSIKLEQTCSRGSSHASSTTSSRDSLPNVKLQLLPFTIFEDYSPNELDDIEGFEFVSSNMASLADSIDEWTDLADGKMLLLSDDNGASNDKQTNTNK